MAGPPELQPSRLAMKPAALPVLWALLEPERKLQQRQRLRQAAGPHRPARKAAVSSAGKRSRRQAAAQRAHVELRLEASDACPRLSGSAKPCEIRPERTDSPLPGVPSSPIRS